MVKLTLDQLTAKAAISLKSGDDAIATAESVLKALKALGEDPIALLGTMSCVATLVYPVSKVETMVKEIVAEAGPLFDALTSAMTKVLDELRAFSGSAAGLGGKLSNCMAMFGQLDELVTKLREQGPDRKPVDDYIAGIALKATGKEICEAMAPLSLDISAVHSAINGLLTYLKGVPNRLLKAFRPTCASRMLVPVPKEVKAFNSTAKAFSLDAFSQGLKLNQVEAPNADAVVEAMGAMEDALVDVATGLSTLEGDVQDLGNAQGLAKDAAQKAGSEAKGSSKGLLGVLGTGVSWVGKAVTGNLGKDADSKGAAVATKPKEAPDGTPYQPNF